MRTVHAVLALLGLPLLGLGCTYEGSGRPPASAYVRGVAPPARSEPPVQSEIQSETAWLREEVRSLRVSLADRDRRETDLWRAYVELSQRLVQLQLAQPTTKQPEPTARQPEPEPEPVAVAPECPPRSASVGASQTPPRKSVVRAINNSQLKLQQKRELIQSMRPPRVIDIANPWDGAN